jgi:hypothetical protein
MFERQDYPEVKLVPGRDIVRPYDVSAWTLPLMMGVEVERAALPSGLSAFKAEGPRLDAASAVALTPDGPENARLVNAALRSSGRVAIARSALTVGGREWPAGTVFMDAAAARAARGKGVPGQAWTAVPDVPAAAEPLTAPRVGLYKPWAASMDEGWTRFLLEQYGFEPKTLDNKAVRAGALRTSFDVIVLPDVPREVIASGKPKREEGEMRYFAELPPEYAGGLDKEGAGALRQFVEQGGTLVAFSAACDYVLEEFNLPVRNALARVRPDEFGVPGSLLRVDVDPSLPLTYGLPATVPVFQDKAIAFDTALPRRGDGPLRARDLPGRRARHSALGLGERHRPPGEARRGRRHRRSARAVWPARFPSAAPGADAGDVPVRLQRALLVDREDGAGSVTSRGNCR